MTTRYAFLEHLRRAGAGAYAKELGIFRKWRRYAIFDKSGVQIFAAPTVTHVSLRRLSWEGYIRQSPPGIWTAVA